MGHTRNRRAEQVVDLGMKERKPAVELRGWGESRGRRRRGGKAGADSSERTAADETVFRKGKPHRGVDTTNRASSVHSQGEVTLSSQLPENFRVQPEFRTSPQPPNWDATSCEE